MSKAGNRDREIKVLRERLSTLTAAILRISASLDVDTVSPPPAPGHGPPARRCHLSPPGRRAMGQAH